MFNTDLKNKMGINVQINTYDENLCGIFIQNAMKFKKFTSSMLRFSRP